MPELPTGTVTLLFTDIAGSTQLLRRLGDAYADVLAEHQRLLREAFATLGGAEVGTQGGAFSPGARRGSQCRPPALGHARGLLGDGPT